MLAAWPDLLQRVRRTATPRPGPQKPHRGALARPCALPPAPRLLLGPRWCPRACGSATLDPAL
eukprot:3135072-Lingulodinium_polyedra.AAC.1